MPTNKIVTINGRTYDAVTGLPVAAHKASPKASAKPAAKPATTPTRPSREKASAVHSSQPQRSKTLHRRATKKPTTGRMMDFAPKSGAKIQRFAPATASRPAARPVSAPAKRPVAKETPLKPAQVHPVAARALEKTAPKKPSSTPVGPQTTKEAKELAIAKAMAAVKKSNKKEKVKRPWVKRAIIIGSVLIALIAILFVVYRFVPTVTVGIASAQAGVKASYPEYVPDGYSLSHPVTYSDGEVRLDFDSNSNDTSYSITQTNSTWDSSAVLDKVVRPAAGENYVITRERGLTLYSYKSSAAWVNGGILYVIESKAPLSGEQIRRIATSL